MKLGFIYGGQGSQREKLGYDFYEKNAFSKRFYDDIPHSKKIKELSFKANSNTLKKTENTQPVLVAYQIMVTDLLKSNNIIPDAVCGLSIGEYGALYSGGVLSKKNAINIAKFRGEAMALSSKDILTSMYAVISDDENKINKILAPYNEGDDFVEISNINSPNQIVISGKSDILKKVIEDLRNRNIKSIKLKVSGAFHTKYMKDASDKLSDYFKTIDFNKPGIDIYLNITGDKYKDENIKEIMTSQVISTVRFYDDIKNMIDDGIDTLVEIGSGNVLSNMISKWNNDIEIFPLGNYVDYENLVEKING